MARTWFELKATVHALGLTDPARVAAERARLEQLLDEEKERSTSI